MDVRNSLKFAINSGNVYCQCNLESHRKNQERKKKKELEAAQELIDGKSGQPRDGSQDSRPP